LSRHASKKDREYNGKQEKNIAKRHTINYEPFYRKLKIEQNEPSLLNSGAAER
jgi:hypothetical protein